MSSPTVAPSNREDDLVSRFDALALSGSRRDPNPPPLTSLPVPNREGGFVGGFAPVSPSPVRRRPECAVFGGESPPAAGASFMRAPIFAMPTPDRQPKPLTMLNTQTPPLRNGMLSPPVPSTPPARPETVPGVIPHPPPLTTSKSDTNTTPTRPSRLRVDSTSSPSTPSKGNTVQCSGVTKAGVDCTRQVKTTLALSASHPDSDPEIERFCFQHTKDILTASAKGFYSHKAPDRYIEFSDWVADYLQPETQLALRVEMNKPRSEADESGYIYTFEIRDPDTPQKIQLKVGRAVNLVRRIDQWDKQCSSEEQVLRGWWPGVVEDVDNIAGVRDLTVGAPLMKGRVKAGEKGPLVHRLERLVHLELGDLAVNAPYLQPDYLKTKNVTNDNGAGTPTKKAPASPPAMRRLKGKPCSDCGQLHKEIFSMTRDEQGSYRGREWELLVKPVIEKWGTFVSEFV